MYECAFVCVEVCAVICPSRSVGVDLIRDNKSVLVLALQVIVVEVAIWVGIGVAIVVGIGAATLLIYSGGNGARGNR